VEQISPNESKRISSYYHYVKNKSVSNLIPVLVHLFVKVLRLRGNSEVSFLVFESSCHLILPGSPKISERQAGKQCIRTFNVFWSDSTR